MLFLATSLFLLASSLVQFNEYFIVWGQSSHTRGAFHVNYLEIGDYLNSLPDNINKYVIVNEDGVAVPYPDGIPMPAQTLIFIERTKFGEPRSFYLKTNEIDKVNVSSSGGAFALPCGEGSNLPSNPHCLEPNRPEERGFQTIKIQGKTVIIPMIADQDLFNRIRLKFPGGQVVNQNDISFYELN